MSLNHVPAEIPIEKLNGIHCARVSQTFAKGVDVQTVIDGTAVAESELWSSDGRMVNDSQWCEGSCGAEHDNAVYFERTGSEHGHGWACRKCRKVTQVG